MASTIPPTYSGSLTEVSLPKLIFHFVVSEATGRLLLVNQAVNREIFFTKGELIAPLLKVQQVYELFHWRQGTYSFYQGQRYSGSLQPMNLDPWELIVQGVRQGCKLVELRQLLTPFLSWTLLPKQNPHVRFNQLGLRPDEQRVLQSIDNQSTIGSLLRRFGGNDNNDQIILSIVYLGLELDLFAFGQELAEDTPSARASRDTKHQDQEEKKIQDIFNGLEEMDLFQRLGLERTCSSAEVTKAFLTAARTYHPDNIPTNTSEKVRALYSQIFVLFSESQQKLGNDDTRKTYLEALEAGLKSEKVDVSHILQAETIFQTGEVLLRAKKYAQALQHFDQAIQVNPEEGEFLIYRGYTMFLANPTNDRVFCTQCTDIIQKGLRMRNNVVANGFLFLGRIFKTMGEEGQAEKMFKEAVSIDPKHTEALREIRLIEMRREKRGSGRRR